MDKETLLKDKANLERQLWQIQGALSYIDSKLKEPDKEA